MKKVKQQKLPRNLLALNPILRKIFADGYEFYGIEENNPLELVNINHLKDYKTVYDNY